MHSALTRLLSIASEAIVPFDQGIGQLQRFLQHWSILGKELEQILSVRNGFWAYESSLLVRPFTNALAPLGIAEWNEKHLWKGRYFFDLDRVLFFAEDAFGCQHCLVDNKVSLFDPETGQFEDFACSLEEWARIVIADSDYRTGYPLAHAWQIQNSPLRPGTRLLPNVPFVLGGKYELENLYICDDIEGMVFRASIANQIRDVPNGGQIVLEVINKKQK